MNNYIGIFDSSRENIVFLDLKEIGIDVSDYPELKKMITCSHKLSIILIEEVGEFVYKKFVTTIQSEFSLDELSGIQLDFAQPSSLNLRSIVIKKMLDHFSKENFSKEIRLAAKDLQIVLDFNKKFAPYSNLNKMFCNKNETKALFEDFNELVNCCLQKMMKEYCCRNIQFEFLKSEDKALKDPESDLSIPAVQLKKRFVDVMYEYISENFSSEYSASDLLLKIKEFFSYSICYYDINPLASSQEFDNFELPDLYVWLHEKFKTFCKNIFDQSKVFQCLGSFESNCVLTDNTYIGLADNLFHSFSYPIMKLFLNEELNEAQYSRINAQIEEIKSRVTEQWEKICNIVQSLNPNFDLHPIQQIQDNEMEEDVQQINEVEEDEIEQMVNQVQEVAPQLAVDQVAINQLVNQPFLAER